MKRMIFITIYLLFCIIYGSAQYTVTTNVKTPKNSTVPDTRIFTGTDFSYTSPQLAALAADLQANYSAELISAPTKKYNCHAYAWHVSEGGNQVWIGYETSTAEDIYWTDGSYIEEPECIATKVSYHESGNHSAIRLNSTWYQSKWGDGPLVKHYLNNVPNGYNPSLQKKYYTLAPSISGPSTVCSSGATFTLNNLPDSASVSWDKSFNLAYVSGQGTISYKVKSSGGILPTVATASGEDLSMMAPMAIESTGSSGWIRATISNSCGDIPLEKTVWAGLPGFIPVVSGYPTVTCGNSLFTEANNRTVTWSVGGPLQIVGSNYGYKCVVRGTGSGVGWVYATAANDCGSFRGELLVEISCGYSLSFSPNPSSGETTIEIATGSGEVLAPDTEWDLEVYDSMQSLKTKTQKLKGDKKAINTTGWKDGVYIVRVKIGKEIISEKLVVKH